MFAFRFLLAQKEVGVEGATPLEDGDNKQKLIIKE